VSNHKYCTCSSTINNGDGTITCKQCGRKFFIDSDMAFEHDIKVMTYGKNDRHPDMPHSYQVR
jgi:transcription elongation factor Elf1